MVFLSYGRQIMTVEKVINNNIVSAYDETGREVVVMGRGIGFGVRAGAVIDNSKIEKVFRIESQGLRSSSRSCWRICLWSMRRSRMISFLTRRVL